MAYWWESDPKECFWCEVTDREDVGGDLKIPTRGLAGEYWSYSLIKAIWPGDIVFHYSTAVRAFIGASVAGGPLEDRPIVWSSHTSRKTTSFREPAASEETLRPGWWLPLHRYTPMHTQLSLNRLAEPQSRDWIVSWIDTMRAKHDFIAAPISRYAKTIRASQGYLFKMPCDWVARWPELQTLADDLSQTQDALAALSNHIGPPRDLLPLKSIVTSTFRLKDAEDYEVVVQGGIQRRTRNHEKLIRLAGEAMKAAGAYVTMPHPIDLMIHSPVTAILEAKTLGGRAPLFAVREAVGQLLEYRHFIGPCNAILGVLLEESPGEKLVAYVEDALGMCLLWFVGGELRGGPRTTTQLATVGVVEC